MLGLAALALAACHPFGLRPTMADRLQGIERFLGSPPGRDLRYLRYAVEGHDGRWSYEIVVAADLYAERRTRLTARDAAGTVRRAPAGSRYAFGRDAAGAWLGVADRMPVVVDAQWTGLALTHQALLGLGFTRPRQRDEAEYLGRVGRGWELAFRPDGGRTLTFSVAPSGEPRAFDVVDDFGRLTSCAALRWERPVAGSVLAGASCSSNDRRGEAGRRSEAHWKLEEARPLDAPPAWAHPAARHAPPVLRAPVEIAIADERRIHLPVRFGDAPPRDVLLDSGAFYTVLDGEAARELGVVPTGEAPLHVRPPWLASSNLWIGVVDRMSVGAAELVGERVLVADNPRMLGGTTGLLGASFFARFVVDVDSPARVVRLWPHQGFAARAGADARLLRMGGPAGSIAGEVEGVARGQVILDTGMAEDLLVHAWQMKVKHPRRRGEDAYLADSPDSLKGSPDYFTEIQGLRLGPYGLPAMPAFGRDRHQERLGGGIALVGMGVLRYFRLAFDFREGMLHVWPGDAYVALRRAGLDVEDGPRGPTVERVVADGPAARGGVAVGDVIRRAASRPVEDAAAARRLIARHERTELRLLVMRRGHPRLLSIAMPTPE